MEFDSEHPVTQVTAMEFLKILHGTTERILGYWETNQKVEASIVLAILADIIGGDPYEDDDKEATMAGACRALFRSFIVASTPVDQNPSARVYVGDELPSDLMAIAHRVMDEMAENLVEPSIKIAGTAILEARGMNN